MLAQECKILMISREMRGSYTCTGQESQCMRVENLKHDPDNFS